MKKYLCLLLTSLLITGCVTTKQPTPSATDNNAKLEEIKIWTLHGKLGIKYQDKGANANLDWHQDHDNYTVKLSGPLGQGGIEIAGNEQHATITDQNGKKVEVQSIEAFFKKRFGWELPIACLTHWVKGIPAPGDHFNATYFSSGKLKTLKQHAWHVEYQEYINTPKGLLPQRLILTHPGTQLKVVVKNWDL